MAHPEDRRSAILIGFLIVAAMVSPARATVPADLCTGDPCEITGAKTVDPDAVLDFPAGTDLVFKASSVVTLAGAGVPRTMMIRAATITMEPNARIVAEPIPDGPFTWGHATVNLEATDGDLVLQGSGSTTARIEGQGNWATSVNLTASGDVILDGTILNRGTGTDPFAGSVSIIAGGAIEVLRNIVTTASGGFGAGGEISLDAGGDVTVNAILDSSGSASPGPVSLVSAAGSITVTARIDSSATSDGSGGDLLFQAPAGDVSLEDTVSGNGSQAGSGDDLSCGDGAAVTIVAGGAISLGEDLSVKGGQTCAGGWIDMSAGTDLTMAEGTEIDSHAGGTDSSGGSLTIFAGGSATLRSIDLSAAGGGGGIDATAAETMTVTGTINARATGSEGVGGGIALTACTISVPTGATLDTRGDGDDFAIQLTASGPMTIAGTLRSSLENRLVYLAVPPVTTGATITPAPVIVNDPALTPCPNLTLCGDAMTDPGEACDDGNNVSCDGCANDCSRIDDVCGDGIRECTEQCDDGNVASGDGCNADCTLPATAETLFPGGGPGRGCQAEWKLFLANPAMDTSSGLPKRTQKCVDGDPGCDIDGANDLRCTFAAEICLRVDDPRLPACQPAPLEFIRIGAPSPFADDPLKAQNGQAILDALSPFGLEIQVATTVVQNGPPFAGSDVCTETFEVAVPRAANNSSKRNFRIGSKDTNGDAMQSNEVSLVCVPNPAVCGNGIVETFEQCDEGDAVACDGCSAGCRIEGCGNGIVECGEQCDEGPANGTPESACTATCTEAPPPLRIPGGGAKKLDCAFEWAVALPEGGVLVDKKGIPRNTQVCTDGDPACDADPAPGSCRLRVWACLGGADARLGCSAAEVTGVDVTSPRANAVGTQLAGRNDLIDALAALGLPAGPGEECTESVSVDVPAGKNIRLKTRATLASKKRDPDTLKLTCRAAG